MIKTQYDWLTTRSITELAQWLDTHGQFDGSPWMIWFEKNYCSKCESVKIKKEDSKSILGFELMFGNETTCSYCEVYKKCKYLPELENTPTNINIIEMWLKEPV